MKTKVDNKWSALAAEVNRRGCNDEKLLIFKKPDGSFSYTPTASSCVSQNAHVAVRGTNEGDVNVNCICSLEILHRIFGALGVLELAPSIFSREEYSDFLREMRY